MTNKDEIIETQYALIDKLQQEVAMLRRQHDELCSAIEAHAKETTEELTGMIETLGMVA